METLIKQRAMSLIEDVPQAYRKVVKDIVSDPQTNEGIEAMMGRESDFRSPLAALFAGIALVPQARTLWEDKLDKVWTRNAIPRDRVEEVVVGSGIQAAIYVAMRVAMGHPAPLVIEKEDRAGGVFAMTRGPAFYLNSRNRPGDLGLPGRKGALNFLPGAILQPSDISGEEYMVNSDLAFIIRATLALSGARVVTGVEVGGVEQDTSIGCYYQDPDYGRSRLPALYLQDNRRVRANRIISATGIGDPNRAFSYSERVLSFPDFMRRMDTPFPLQGLGKVAVIGAGDSGKVVIEALTGLGPARHMSVASLDWMDEIRWIGPGLQTSQTDWESCNRPRYKQIGTLLKSTNERPARVRAEDRRLDTFYVDDGFNNVLIEGVPYDTVIDCTGFYENRSVGNSDGYASGYARPLSTGYRSLARKRAQAPYQVYLIGPCSQLDYESFDTLATPLRGDARQQRENRVAIYRFADRTAELAQSLS